VHSGLCLIDRRKRRFSLNPESREAASLATSNFWTNAAVTSPPAIRSPACAIASRTSNNLPTFVKVVIHRQRLSPASLPIDTCVINTLQGDKNGMNGNERAGNKGKGPHNFGFYPRIRRASQAGLLHRNMLIINSGRARSCPVVLHSTGTTRANFMAPAGYRA
jgi:hypothetical protein